MNTNILVEGNADGVFIATLIADEQAKYGVEVRVVGGSSAIFSYARTLLATRRTPVAVLIDADSSEPGAVEERRRNAVEVIGESASGLPFCVLVAVPELDVLFFERPELLRRVFGEHVDAHMLELGRLSPKRAFRKLSSNKPLELVRIEVLKKMDSEDLRALRKTPLIAELLEFIQKAEAYAVSSSI